MNCQWCFQEVEEDNQEPVQFCSDACKMMHPFGSILDDINEAINSGRSKESVMLTLNRSRTLVEPLSEPEPVPEQLPPTDEFDR